ncbi:SapC family protein [Alphaproteobacteria bacterium]|nr:SapC family protein [Alphaproteobacteria bacterium]
MKLRALSKDEHKNLRLSADKSLEFISQLPSMPITIQDLSLLGSRLPVAFLKKKEGFELNLICGVDPNENIAVSLDNRQWVPGPFPSLYQHYPFVLAKKDDQFILCFDENSN